jgi:vacuolar-type H+-ATPase subunit C/Vma6
MLDAGERAYAYTKACGIIGKSFVGKRVSALTGLRSLNELDRLVFPDLRRELPGRELLIDLESRIVKRTVRQILSVINAYVRPPELLIRQLRSYEYEDLKTCLHYLAGRTKALPALSDIGRFKTVHFEAFPDLTAMLTNTEFDFILSQDIKAIQSGKFNLTALETELDLRYYTALKESLRHLWGEDRVFAERILAEEISLRNCIWALRLRTYFKKNAAETGKYLMDIKMCVGLAEIPGDVREHKNSVPSYGKEVALAAEAFESLDMPLDLRSAWRRWRWEQFLNPEKPGELWTAEPRYFQNAASGYLYQLALRCFHTMPFAVSTVFCFIKLKQFEEDLLTSIAEGLGLGMLGSDVFELLEVQL